MQATKSLTYPFPIEQLKKWTIQDILDAMQNPEKLVQGPETTSVREALKAMEESAVSSILIFRKEGENKVYEGFITVKDIIQFVAFQKDIDKTEGSDFSFMDTPIKNLQGYNEESRSLPVLSVTHSLLDLIDHMKRGKHFVLAIRPQTQHQIEMRGNVKVYVAKGDDQAFVISQGDVIQFLANPMTQVEESELTAASMSFASARHFENDPNQLYTGGSSRLRHVHHQSQEVSALACFKSMIIHRISSIAIVDKEGKLVETLSASDFARFSSVSLDRLYKPVVEFLKEAYDVSIKPITVKGDASLRNVLEVFREHGVHRLWIVDGDNKPTGCVSMSDVLASIIPSDLKTVEE